MSNVYVTFLSIGLLKANIDAIFMKGNTDIWLYITLIYYIRANFTIA